MGGAKLPLTPLLAHWRASAHLNPTIWRLEQAYDTGKHRFGGSAQNCTDHAN